MKYIILIINFYLLILSCIVCGDKDNCQDNQNHQTTIGLKQHLPLAASEICTPFCTCAHCPASAFFEQTKVCNDISKQFFANTYSVQENFFSPRFEFSIWQPPKIS